MIEVVQAGKVDGCHVVKDYLRFFMTVELQAQQVSKHLYTADQRELMLGFVDEVGAQQQEVQSYWTMSSSE